jgi:hypothetical protein
MGIGAWLSKLRKQEDVSAVKRAEDDMAPGSLEEHEARSGDMEGLAADERAARSAGETSMGDIDRLGDD